jgi:hypothetical protein
LTFLFSCNSKQEKQDGYGEGSNDSLSKMEEPIVHMDYVTPKVAADMVLDESDNSKTETLGDKSTVSKNKIIKDGSISIKTNDINSSKKVIDDLLKKFNAYYETEDLENNEQTISFNLKIRVPVNKFEQLISSLENGKDEIRSKSIQARDVTEEYVDIETRLTNKREYLKRYKELLAKASTVKDIIAIEENIRNLQEEIESKEGRLKYLNDQVSFSTLDLNLYKEIEFIYKPQAQDKFSERVKTSLNNGWTSIVDFALWTITKWPYLILTIVGFFGFKRIIKRRKSRKA